MGSHPKPSRPAAEAPKVPASRGLIEADLSGWAGEETAKLGRKDALLGRVERMHLADGGLCLEARVRGERPAPHVVRIWDDVGRLTLDCDCAAGRGEPCRHAVAALQALRFPLAEISEGKSARRRRSSGRARKGSGRVVRPPDIGDGFVILGEAQRNLTREERVRLARQDELRSRRQRARREKTAVRQINETGEPPRFRVDRSEGDPAIVVLRGPKGLWARCDCADYAENELGTCRHIERVRIWFLRKKKIYPTPSLSFWWMPKLSGEQAPDPLREFRCLQDGTVPDELRRWIDEGGWMREPEPGAYGPAWVAQALHAAQELARRRNWIWDQDSLVEPRLSRAQRSRVDGRPRAEGPEWERMLEGLGFRLHPYQVLGARFLVETGRAFLADDMGLGKTVQAIAAAQFLRGTGDVRRTLVVCPASLKHQWAREILKACGEKATVLEGRRSLRLEQIRTWNEGYLIANYELVLRDLAALQSVHSDLVILDEAQRIKNWGTKTAKSVKRLRASRAFILTGTPLENRLGELHSLVEFLSPRALGPRWRLFPFHAVTAEEGRVIAYEGLNVLRQRLKPFFLRRERTQVLDQLPDRTDNTFWTEMTPGQRGPYRQQARQLAQLLGRNQALRQHEVRLMLQLLTRMRILCNAGAQNDWEGIAPRILDPRIPTHGEIKTLNSPKLEEFSRVLEDLLDGGSAKVVVFSQWERTLRLAEFVVREPLAKRELRCEIFHGSLSTQARGAMIERFHDDPAFRVMFSTDAGGLGLNLQEAASIVVNLEVPWNPATLAQRIGRVHRMGQRRGVQALHFVTRDALEERVRQVLENKQALFSGLLSENLDRVQFEDDASSGSWVERVRSLVEPEGET